MKKLLFTLFLLLLTTNCFAADYWVYIRTYDRPELTVGEGGRSKKGDIVQILPCTLDGKAVTPSKVEQKEWLIIKVSDLTALQIADAMQSWQDQTGTTADGHPIYTIKAYRKNKLDLDKFKTNNAIVEKEGLVSKTISNTAITLTAKTALDLSKYEAQARWYAVIENNDFIEGIKYAWNWWIRPAYAATLTNTVITSGGGDYLTLNAAEDALDGNLTDNGGDIQVINCSGATADATAVTFAGWTTSATCYIEIAGNWDASTDLKYTTAKYHLVVPNVSELTIANSTAFVRIHNLQIYNSDINTDNIWGILVNVTTSQTGSLYIYNNCLRGNVDHDWYDVAIYYLGNGSSITSYIYNNWIYNWGKSDSHYGAIVFDDAAAATTYFENNTCVGNYAGIVVVLGTVTARNNIIKDSGNTYTYVGTFTGDYNVTDGTDVTSQGANSHTGHTFSFVDAANGDFHLLSTDTGAIDLGTSSVNSGYTVDIDNVARGATWDIGADEYVAAGGAAASTGTVMIVD